MLYHPLKKLLVYFFTNPTSGELCNCEGTTGANEVTTIDELHYPVLLGGGEGGGTLTSKYPVKPCNFKSHSSPGFSSSFCSHVVIQKMCKFITTVSTYNQSSVGM